MATRDKTKESGEKEQATKNRHGIGGVDNDAASPLKTRSVRNPSDMFPKLKSSSETKWNMAKKSHVRTKNLEPVGDPISADP